MNRLGKFFCLAAAAVALLPSGALGQSGPPRPTLAGKLATCRVAGLAEDALCGRHDVPEKRSESATRTIGLNVVVLPATTDTVLPDPLVFLAGGGVVPATRYARFLATALPALRRHRDVLLVDQRGTGGTNPLACDRATLDTATGLPPNERYLRFIAACRSTLATRADVRLYTTAQAIEDLDDVRAWLGYEVLDLYGASYGTSVAAAYVRQYPSRVRSVVMHGVVPLDVSMQVDLAQSAQRSLERVVALCESDASCHASYPTLDTDLTRVLGPLEATPSTEPRPGAGAARAFRDRLNTALATIDGIRDVPALVHDAANGVLPGDGPPPSGPEPAPLGVRLAILCSEGLAGIDTASISRASAGTFLGDFPVRFQLRWCDGWPTAPLPANFHTAFRSTVPALLLSGELDPITPPAYAERVGGWFEHSVVLRLPNRSHSDTDPCVMGLIEAFVMSGGARPADTCLESTPRIAFTVRR